MNRGMGITDWIDVGQASIYQEYEHDEVNRRQRLYDHPVNTDSRNNGQDAGENKQVEGDNSTKTMTNL